MLSVIIPTRNRAELLGDAVKSIQMQTLRPDEFEVLIVDNGSTDGTMELVKKMASHDRRIRYLFAQEPGLHVGRHLGMGEARGNILVYTDDDIIASPQWLEAIRNAFEDAETVLVGGPILPKWEGDVPEWVRAFKDENKYGWMIGFLSLIDLGDRAKVMSPMFVYGCNFSIRKDVLYECGGFHPDGMPQELIKYRGDGETGLALAIKAKGYKAFYEARALVYHRVPKERLTLEYLCQRYFNQGISFSFAETRKENGLNIVEKSSRIGMWIRDLASLVRIGGKSQNSDEHPIKKFAMDCHMKGRVYYQAELEKDTELLKYVLKERYF